MNKDYIKVVDALREAKSYIESQGTYKEAESKSKREVLKVIRHALSPSVTKVAEEVDDLRELKDIIKNIKRELYTGSYWGTLKNFKDKFDKARISDRSKAVNDTFINISIYLEELFEKAGI